MSLVNLASNENPYGPSPRAADAIKKAAAGVNLYPQNGVPALRERLAALHGVKDENILVGAGSTALLGLLARGLLAPGLNAVSSERSFIVYAMAAEAAEAELIRVPMRESGYDLAAVAGAIDGNTRVVFLANPNNPTGTLFDVAATDAFIAAMPPQVTVVLDEAYYDYAQFFAERRGVRYSRSFEYVNEGRRVVVLRTFSKTHGLAGLRVGYAAGPAQLIAKLARLQDTYAVSAVAEAGALAALDDDAHVRCSVARNAEQSEIVIGEFEAMGCRVVPTWANFVYCELGQDAEAVARRLVKEGVQVRPLGVWGAPMAVRVTIGTAEQNQLFLEAMRRARS